MRLNEDSVSQSRCGSQDDWTMPLRSRAKRRNQLYVLSSLTFLLSMSLADGFQPAIRPVAATFSAEFFLRQSVSMYESSAGAGGFSFRMPVSQPAHSHFQWRRESSLHSTAVTGQCGGGIGNIHTICRRGGTLAMCSKNQEDDVTEELAIQIARKKLHDRWFQTRLKAKTLHLPFERAVQWVRAAQRWDTKEDWEDWISMGEKKNQYIPSNPEKYYGERGEWKGWDYWLGVNQKDDSSNEGDD